MPLVTFEPTTSAGERPQTYALDRAATGIGCRLILVSLIHGVYRYVDFTATRMVVVTGFCIGQGLVKELIECHILTYLLTYSMVQSSS